MALILPVNSTGDRRIQLLLGQNLLSIRTYWNPTVPGWYMDLYGPNGLPIALGLALVPVVNVLESQQNITRVYGQFRVFTLDGGENATSDSLGRTAKLWWFAPGEWEANEIEAQLDVELPFDVRAMYTPPPPSPDLLVLDGSWMLDGTYYLNGEKVPAEVL